METPHSFRRIYKFLGLAFLLFSCASDLDIDQVDDLKLEPVYVTNLAFFDVPANKFADDGTAEEIAFDTQPFNVFKEKFFTDRLVKAELNFEIENTINRSFSLDVVLHDKNNAIIETLNFPVPAYTGGENIAKYKEVFEAERLALLKKTVKVSFTVRIGAGPALNENSVGNLKLRSSATAYMEIKK